jgi:hypothetical protein
VHCPDEVAPHGVVPEGHEERRKATRSTPEGLMRLECQAMPMSVVLLKHIGPCNCPSEPLPESAVNGPDVVYASHRVSTVLACTGGNSHQHGLVKLVKQD